MSDGPRLLLDPSNPNDFDPGELEALAAKLEAETPELEAVAIRRPEEGYGGPLIEVLHVWQEYSNTVGGIGPTVVGVAWLIRALQKRWRTDRDEHPPPERPRPRILDLYDENDELIRSVRIDLPEGEPIEVEVTPGERGGHPRPKLDWTAKDDDAG